MDTVMDLFKRADAARSAAAGALRSHGIEGTMAVRVLSDDVDEPEWWLRVDVGAKAYVVRLSADLKEASVFEHSTDLRAAATPQQ